MDDVGRADLVPQPQRRRWPRHLLIVSAALVGVVAMALLVVHLPIARQYVTGRVAAFLDARGVSVRLDGLEYNLFDLRVSLRNVVIRSARAPDLPPFATLDRVMVDLGLVSLLRGRYVVEVGEVEGLDLRYVVDEGGLDNVPRFGGGSEGGGEGPDYLIEDLRITRGSLQYEQRARGLDVVITGFSGSVKGDALRGRHAVVVSTETAQVVAGERSATIDSLTANLDAGRDDIRIVRLDAAGEGATIRLTGTVSDFEAPQLGLRGHVTADIARAVFLARVEESASGAVEVDLEIAGPLSLPRVTASVTGRDVAFRDLREMHAVARVEYDVASSRVEFEQFELRAPFGVAAGTGAFALSGDGESRVNMSASALQLAPLMRAFTLPVTLLTRVDARIEGRWSGRDVRGATGMASATLTPLRGPPEMRALPVGGRVEIATRPGEVVIAARAMYTDGARLNGSVQIRNQTRLAGGATLQVDDVGRLVRTMETTLGRAPSLPVTIHGAATGTLEVGGLVKAPRIAAVIDARALVIGTAPEASLHANVVYAPTQVSLRQLSVNWQGGMLRAAGSVGLAGARPLDVMWRADALSVEALARAAGQIDPPVSGVLSADGRVEGTLSEPAVRASVGGTTLVAYGEEWGTLAAQVALAGRRVEVAHLTVEKPQPDGNGRIVGSGRYDLDGRTLSVDLQASDLRLVGLTLPGGPSLRGGIDMSARAEGSIDDPAATVDITAASLSLDQHQIGDLSVHAVVADHTATVRATAPMFGLGADAMIGVDEPYRMVATVRLDGLRLESLPLTVETPFDGVLDATLDIAADLQEPRAAVGTARITRFAGVWNQHAFSVEAPSEVRYAAEQVTIPQLRFVAEDSTVVLSGDLPIAADRPAGTITIDARANLATLAGYAPAGSRVQAAGALALMGVVRGSLQAIDPTLSLSVTDGSVSTVDSTGLSGLTLVAELDGGVMRVTQLDASLGSGTISATAEIPLDVLPALPIEVPRPGGAMSLMVTAQGIELGQLPGTPDGLAGQLGMRADLRAGRADVAAVEGEITFDQLQLAFNELTLTQEAPSVVRLGAGEARVERFALAGSVGTVSATGAVGLTGDRTLDVDLAGDLNIGVVSLFTDVVRAEGRTTLAVSAGGTLARPDLAGRVELSDATFLIDDPTVAIQGVEARLDLSGQRVTVSELTGTINGGDLSGSGFVELGNGTVADAAVTLTATDVANDFPLDLRSLSSTTLRLSRQGDDFLLAGTVVVEEGGLTGDVNFDEGLLAAMSARRRLDLTEERNAFLERLRFDIAVETASPLLVENNLARAEITTDLRVIGTRYEPGLAGQVSVLEGGEITLNERRYEVERGIITFVGERDIRPSFNLLLHTTAQNYDITLAVTGTPGDTETTLTADPTLPEPDIMALLATGRTLDEMRGAEFEVAQEQVLSYLAGRVGSQLGRGLEEATGLSRVRIEPNLIANETDPSARLTVGQELTPTLELVYSVDLTDSNDQIWIAEYDVTRRFQSSVVRQSDASYRMEFRHDVRFGGSPAPSRTPRIRPVVDRIVIENSSDLPEPDVRRLLGVTEGSAFDFIAAQEGADRLREALAERGRLESRVRVHRQITGGRVSLTAEISAGPRVDIVFEGLQPPDDVVREVRTQWQRGVFDAQRIGDSVELIRGWLMQDDYLQARVTGQVMDVGPGARRARFTVEAGSRFSRVSLTFPGAMGIDPDVLIEIVAQQDLELELFADPIVVTTLLQKYYREQGYLVAEVEEPRYEFSGSEATVRLDIREGPRFVVRHVTTTGNVVLNSDLVLADLPLVEGQPFLPFAAENAVQRIRDRYWRRGYNDARPDFTLRVDRQAGVVDVAFTIEEGDVWVVDGIVVQGTEKTDEQMAREQIELAPGDPLDLRALARSRSNLYNTHAYSFVDLTREPLPASEGTQPVRLNVSVREVQPTQLRYGASFDTERGFGGIADLSRHNLFGGARTAGFRTRVDGQITDVRGYFNQPVLRGWPIETTASVYYRDEQNPETGLTGRFDIERRGVSVQQERRLRNSYLWSYGYRYERARSANPATGGLLGDFLTVAPLMSTFTRESRDEVLDATHGSFSSHAFQYSPSWLGAEQAYLKYFGQYFQYVPLQPVRRERLTGEILRPRFVFASGVRLGLARALDGVLPLSERFFAGGSSSLRGFAQNAVGPIGADRIPIGGEGLLVINGEVRFPLVGIFDGVGFVDIGNVFQRVSDFGVADLRKSGGVGLRIRTPWFLGRLDYGVPFGRRSGEASSRLYFSIGQAF